MAKKAAPPSAEKDRSERWLLTYSDLVTLLLIFFIVLYVMSVQDVTKFKSVADSLIDAFKGTRNIIGEAPGPALIEGISGLSIRGKTGKEKEKIKAQYIKQEIERLSESEDLQNVISAKIDDRGIVISIEDKALFESGKADISFLSRQVLEKIGKILQINKTQYMRVEGHSDNVPIQSDRFASNWELSTSRATNVVRFLIQQSGLDASLFSANGYGEFRPVADNNTEEGRAKNRRVEIIILSSSLNKSEPKAAAQ